MSITFIQWLDGLFDDVTRRMRLSCDHMVGHRGGGILTVHVRPADRPTMSLSLDGDQLSDLRSQERPCVRAVVAVQRRSS